MTLCVEDNDRRFAELAEQPTCVRSPSARPSQTAIRHLGSGGIKLTSATTPSGDQFVVYFLNMCLVRAITRQSGTESKRRIAFGE